MAWVCDWSATNGVVQRANDGEPDALAHATLVQFQMLVRHIVSPRVDVLALIAPAAEHNQ